ncbi:MAG: helix-turn-helix domain-containing protein, partial [Ruminococcus sp.]
MKMKEQILAVQRMQDYIEQHLEEQITLEDLSSVSMFSPWYSYRLFKEETGLTPSEYIRKLRLSRSALNLRDKKSKVTDTAFDYGFGSVDGYTRAFCREYGLNPKEYSKSPVPIPLFIPYGVKFREIQEEKSEMKDVQSVFLQVVEKPKRKVIIKRGVNAEDYFQYCAEVGCDVWGILTSIPSISGEPVCLWLPQKYIKANTSTYVQGVEVSVDYSGEIPDGFEVIELPQSQYLMFQGEPFLEEDYCKAIDALRQSVEKYDPSIIGMKWDKENPSIQLEPIGTRGYIELHPVSPLK